MNQFGKRKKTFLVTVYKFSIVVIAGIIILHHLILNSSLFYRETIYLPFSLHLNQHDLYLQKGEEFRLVVYAVNKRVSFSSTNFRIAGVNFNGRVFAYRTGKTFILAKVDGKVLKCRVHVIDINKKKLRLRVGETYRLKIKGTFAYSSWKSNQSDIVQVNMFGKVKAVKRGEATITGKVKGKKLTCTIVVE